MKKSAVLAFGFPVLGLLAACNYDTGECYVRGQDGTGAGGAVITPPGSGGFGDVPPKPLDANGDLADPCSQVAECTVTWKAGSDSCKDVGATGTCTSLHQGSYVTLDDAKKDCERIYGINPPTNSGALSCDSCHWANSTANDCLEQCKDLCYELWVKCREACPKGDGNCLSECTNKLADCNRECDKKCK